MKGRSKDERQLFLEEKRALIHLLTLGSNLLANLDKSWRQILKTIKEIPQANLRP